MRRAICLAIGLCVCTGTVRAEEKKHGEMTDPLAILKKVDAAAKAVKAVRMEAKVEGQGAAEARMPRISAVCSAVGLDGRAPKKWICQGKLSVPGSEETKELTAGTDGDDSFLIDHSTKKAYVDMDPAVMGRMGHTLGRAIMIEYLHDTPFSDEINAKSRELKGSKTIGGEDCYEILVVYAADNAQSSTWWFSKKDFLPRARLQHFTLPTGEKGGGLVTLTNVKVNPKFTPDTFKFKLPTGFEQVDDFAP